MGSIYFCDQSELIGKASDELKKVDSIKQPVWAAIVKTGMHNERPPSKSDWWYTRSASVLRQVYKYGPVGVAKLRTRYGGKKNRGMKPGRFYKGSGNIIRKILQQLEAAGFVKKEEKDIHKGRKITADGKKFLDSIASQLYKAPTKSVVKKEGAKPVSKKPGAKKEDVTKKPELKDAPKKEVKQEAKPAPKKEVKQEAKPAPKKEIKAVEKEVKTDINQDKK